MLVSTGRSLSIWKFRNDDLIFFGASFIILGILFGKFFKAWFIANVS